MLPNIGNQFRVEFDLYLDQIGKNDPYNPLSILHITTGGDCCAPGQRTPAVFIYGHYLHFATDLNGNGNAYYGPEANAYVNAEQWYNLDMSQIQTSDNKVG